MSRLIIISGPNFAGKTSLANCLAKSLQNDGKTTSVISMTDYFKVQKIFGSPSKYEYMISDPDKFDFIALESDILDFIYGREFSRPKFDTKSMKRSSENVLVSPCDYLILEGTLGLYDAGIYCKSFLNVYLDLELVKCFARFLKTIDRSSMQLEREIQAVWNKRIKPLLTKIVIPTVSQAVEPNGLLVKGDNAMHKNLEEIMNKIKNLEQV